MPKEHPPPPPPPGSSIETKYDYAQEIVVGPYSKEEKAEALEQCYAQEAE